MFGRVALQQMLFSKGSSVNVKFYVIKTNIFSPISKHLFQKSLFIVQRLFVRRFGASLIEFKVFPISLAPMFLLLFTLF